MARKTVDVEYVRIRVNDMLDSSVCPDIRDDVRVGLCVLLEDILHETGNYKGFSYLFRGEDGKVMRDENDNIVAPYQRYYN